MTENQRLCEVLRMLGHNIFCVLLTAADPSTGMKKVHQLNEKIYTNDEIKAVINKEPSL